MSTRTKHLWLVIIAQAGCVAVGLLMQHQFVRASSLKAAEEHARSELAATVNELAAQLAPSVSDRLMPGTREFERAQELLTLNRPASGGALIVDGQWRIVAQDGAALLQQTSGLAHQEQISWEWSAKRARSAAGPMAGALTIQQHPQIAAARALDGSSGYVVVYRSAADVAATQAVLLQSLPMVSGITFFWTCALLSTIVFVVLSRFHTDADRERKQAAAQTLRRTQNLVRTRDSVIFGLAKLADSRDPDTGDHLERISLYSTMLASVLHRHPKYHSEVTPAFVKLIGISSALHDVGKVGIEDSILRKPGKLTDDERTRMQRHANLGGDCLREIEQRLGSSNFLQMAREIAFAHHERWDGTGYPNGIAGEDIPLAARVVAIADVYDALSSKRVYKAAFPHEECVAIIRSQTGKHFDPDLVDVWLKLESRFCEVAMQYADSEQREQMSGKSTEAEVEDNESSEDIPVPSTVSAG